MFKVFISYARDSESAARRVSEGLAQEGYDVWWDDQIPPHRAYAEVIAERLKDARAVLVLWTKSSVKSEWVRAEADDARVHGKLVQAILDDSIPPLPFNQIQAAHLTGWTGDRADPRWRKIVGSIATLAGPPKKHPIKPVAEAPADSPPPRKAIPKAVLLSACGLAAVALVATLAFVALHRKAPGGPQGELAAIVMPFKALSSDPVARTFAEAADGEITGRLTETQVPTAPAARAAEAAFAVSGTVQGDASVLHIRVQLEETKSHTTLWSAEFERPPGEAAALRAQIGWRVSDVLHNAIEGRREDADVDPQALALFVQCRDALSSSMTSASALAARAVARDPRFALAYAMDALTKLAMVRGAPDDVFEPARRAAAAEGRKAAVLDPNLSLAYLIQSMAEPGRHWAVRESLLRQALVRAPLGGAPHELGEMLSMVGRQSEGLVLSRQAVAERPGFTINESGLAANLLRSGLVDEARQVAKARLATRPDDSSMRSMAFKIEAFGGAPRAALDILADPARRPGELAPAAMSAYRAFLDAQLSASAANSKAAVSAILAAVENHSLDRATSASMLSALGAIDDALRLAADYANDPKVTRQGGSLYPGFLFSPETVRLRADPRIVPIFRDLGLLDYWRSAGHWPDFCETEPKSVCAAMKAGAKGV